MTQIEKQTFGKKKKVFAGPQCQGHRVDLKQALSYTYPYFAGPLRFFKQLGGRSKFLPKSLGLDYFEQKNLPAKETFWGGKVLSPCTVTLMG